MEKNVKIYKLIDPRTNDIRYIGKTVNTLNRRLTSHIYSAKNKNTHKDCWISCLLKLDLKPIIELIELVSQDNWKTRECYWIKYYRDIGVRLTNTTDGGDDGNYMIGDKNPNFGKKIPPERVQVMKKHLYLTAQRVVPFSEFDNIKEMYLKGSSEREIAKFYKCNHKTINKIISNMNIRRQLTRQSIKEQDIIYVYKLRQKGLSINRISKIFKRDSQAILTALKKYSEQQGENNA